MLYTKFITLYIFTGRNEVVAKVMFLLVSVILSTGGGGLPQCMLGYHPPREAHTPPGSTPLQEEHPSEAHPLGITPPPRETDSGIRSMSGRYASYWNAFLLSYWKDSLYPGFTLDIKGPHHFYDVLYISTCLTLCWFIIDTRFPGLRQPYWHFKVQILEHQTLIKLSGQGYSKCSSFKYICSNNTFLITAMVLKLKLQNDDSPFPQVEIERLEWDIKAINGNKNAFLPKVRHLTNTQIRKKLVPHIANASACKQCSS